MPLTRIPHVSTCMKIIYFSDNYDDDEIEKFNDDLKIAFEKSNNNGFCD